jgi:hypothetical protein
MASYAKPCAVLGLDHPQKELWDQLPSAVKTSEKVHLLSLLSAIVKISLLLYQATQFYKEPMSVLAHSRTANKKEDACSTSHCWLHSLW